jgi:hypothetical protein
MRYPHICPYCEHRSTRWWNMKIHIKRKHGGFLPGRSSGPYMTNNPLFDRKSVQFGHPTIADSVGNTFQPRYLPQQAPLGISQYFSSQILRTPLPRMDEKYGTGFSQDNIIKIEEFKRLMNKYQKYHMNPGGIIQWAIHSTKNGDNKFLDDKLQQLRIMDRRLNGLTSPFTVF